MSGKLSRTVLRRGKGSNPFSLVEYTSKEFAEFCSKEKITQSMSKAGCPYDNAPMERYFNTFKNELIYLFYFKDDNLLNKAVYDYAYSWYNHIRPLDRLH